MTESNSYRSIFTDLDISEKWLGKSNAYEMALALLSEYEYLVEHSNKNIRDKMLSNVLETIQFTDSNSETEQNIVQVSILDVAKNVVNLVESYGNIHYVNNTLLNCWRTTFPPRPKNDEEKVSQQIDHYQLSWKEFHIPLGSVSIKNLVKGLRFMLYESVSSCFPENLNPQQWTPKLATFRSGNKRTTTTDHQAFVEKLMYYTEQLTYFSEDLKELVTVINDAFEKGKYEAEKRKSETQSKKNKPQTVKQVVETETETKPQKKKKTEKRYAIFEVIEKDEVEQVEQVDEATEKPVNVPRRESPPRKPIESKWSKGNPLVSNSNPETLKETYEKITQNVEQKQKPILKQKQFVRFGK